MNVFNGETDNKGENETFIYRIKKQNKQQLQMYCRNTCKNRRTHQAKKKTQQQQQKTSKQKN